MKIIIIVEIIILQLLEVAGKSKMINKFSQSWPKKIVPSLGNPTLTVKLYIKFSFIDVAFSSVSWIPNVKVPMDHDLWYVKLFKWL